MSYSQSAPTQYVTATNGIKYAYRRLGQSRGVPLMMAIHFRGNMDYWDPILLNALADKRPVIIFDQPGVGKSDGSVPTTFQGWADDWLSLIDALQLTLVDLLGFSMGGRAAQMVTLTRSSLVRKLILTGIDGAPEEGISRTAPEAKYIEVLFSATNAEQMRDAIAPSCFYEDDRGHAAFKAY